MTRRPISRRCTPLGPAGGAVDLWWLCSDRCAVVCTAVIVAVLLGDAQRAARAPRRRCRDRRAGDRRVTRVVAWPRPSRSCSSSCSCRRSIVDRAREPRSMNPAHRHDRGSPGTSGGGRWTTRHPTPALNASRPRTRSTSRSAGRCSFDAHVARRDPQLLGAEPARQEGPDSRATHNASGSRPTGRASIAASAPSSAATSTRTWRFDVVAEPQAEFERVARRAAASRPREPADARHERGQEVFLTRAVRHVPHDPRHVGRLARRARPDPRREPHDARRRHAAEHARPPRRLDRRPAAHQAGQPHAAEHARARRI